MKQGIHPKYEPTTITCVCGASYTIRATKAIKKIEICANCHPFFTGKQKYVDAAGRVEKFKQRFSNFTPPPKAAKGKKGAAAAAPAAEPAPAAE